MLKLTIFLITIHCIYGIIDITSEKIVQNPYPNYINRKEESARRFLHIHNSLNPVVLLIDNIGENQEEAYNFFKTVHKLEPAIKNVNFLLMKFNTTGVSPVLETTKNNRIRFESLLKQQFTKDPSNFLSRDTPGKSAVLFAIINACQKLNQNGSIVVFMSREIEDNDLAQLAFVEVVKRNIRVIVIWGGRMKDSLLEQLANRSGGSFLTSSSRDSSKVYFEQFLESIDSNSSLSIILSKKNLRGKYNLHFPIDFDVTSIHIVLTPNVTSGILTTPRGYKIDVLESEDVAQYSVGSFMNRDGGIHEIHINTTTATTQDVGIWSFRLENARAFYNITIFAHSKITTNAYITVENATDVENKTGKRKKIMKLGVSGDISSIKNISFVSQDGDTISDNVKFMLSKDWENHLTENIKPKGEIIVNTDKIPKEPFYAVVNGKDSKGNDFTRLSYVKSGLENKMHYLPPLTIDVGLGSELITQPFRQPQIFFEVTNNANTPTLVRFKCIDEKAILFSMNPWYKWISPQETTTVHLTLITRSGYYQDRITLIAQGSERVSKDVIVDVGLNNQDTRDPELDYYFTSDCLNVLWSGCEEGTWTVEVKAKDTGSGLLQVASNPRGIVFPNGFTTGTTEEITGYYSESCCNPDLQVIAFDRQNNRKTRNLNAYRANLGPGAIAAIVLGVLLLILIIIAIILLIRAKGCPKCPTKKESYDLPTYRGPKRH